MTICYFGIYTPHHPRNIVFIRCLKQAGFDVLEINCRDKGLIKYYKLAKELFSQRKKIDFVMVGFPGQQAVILAKLFFRGPVIFNPLLSLYDAIIDDRKDYSRWSIRAVYFWLLDFVSVHMADHVILDNNTHTDYFSKTYKLPKRKTSRIFLGADETVFRSHSGEEKKFEIHYYGSFIPVHGTDVIIQAAKLLEHDDITFIISGRGQYYERDRKLAQKLDLHNLQFIDKLKSAEELNHFINSSWVCLGLFAMIPRTPRSIASKVFEAICCARPVITVYTPAGAELLENNESVLFVKPNNPEDLAQKIRILKKDDVLRQKIARGGRRAYEKYASFEVITRQLKDVIEKLKF